MKKIFQIIMIGGVIGAFFSCKKDNAVLPDNDIVGKWQEAKLTISQTNGTQTTHDTTFASNAFTASDYMQFNKDNTAVISQSGIYYVTGKSEVLSGGVVQTSLGNYTYGITDTTLTLTFDTQFIHPTNGSKAPAFKTAAIIQLDTDHLVLKTNAETAAPFKEVQTLYFTRVK